MVFAQIQNWVPRTQGPLVFLFLTLTLALPKIQDCSETQFKFFKELCAYPNGSENRSNFTQSQGKKWALSRQKRQDLEQIRVKF